MNAKQYRILFLNSIRENMWGGGENLMYNLAIRLKSRGHAVWVAGRNGGKFMKHFSDDEVKLVPLNIKGDFGPVNIAHLAGLMAKEKIDFIWVNFNKDLRLGGIAARISGKAKVIWLMGVCLPERSLVHRITGRRLPHRIVVPSQGLKDRLRQFSWIDNEKVTVVRNGIDFGNLQIDRQEARRNLCKQFSIDTKCRIIGVPARLVEAKGHVYLLEAIPEVIKCFPDVRFIFAGDGSERKDLEGLTAKLNLGNHVIFAGHIKDIYQALAGFDILALPSITDTAPLALIEGMGLGIPIVASAVGGIPEIVEDNVTGLLVPAKEPQLLAKSILKLLNNPELCSNLGESGRTRAMSLFDIEMMMDEIVNVMDGLSPFQQG